jgi:glycosyltransferase involved in cell wall biosynthesis
MPVPQTYAQPTTATAAVRPLRVAVVDEELPYPATSGKRIRTLNLLVRLARRHSLTYLCHRNADPDEARRAAEFFRDQGIETVVADRAVPPKSGLGFYARLAGNLASPLPYSVATHVSRGLRAALEAHAATNAVDVWHCEWTPYAEVLRGVAGARPVVMAHNVESLIWRRYHETERNGLKRWYIKQQWRKFERFERRTAAEAARVVAVSIQDADVFRSRFGARRVDVVENGVDLASFTDAGLPREAGRVLFLGSLDWRPNLDAVGLLLDQVFPEVRAREPSARLTVVGRNPPDRLVRRVSGAEGVELVANAPDVRPYLTRCGLMVVPLRIGGGSRIKILEALACGLPVVSTRVGAEGLSLEPGRDLVVVDLVEGMAGALLAAIRDPARARATAESGRRVVLGRYGWDALAEELERVWVRCLGA